MFNELAGALRAGLSLWNRKDARKYQDRILELEKQFYDEDNKDRDHRDDAKLDRIRFELRQLARAWTAEVGKPDASNQP